MKYIFLSLFLLGSFFASGQEFWSDINVSQIENKGFDNRSVFPKAYRTVRLNLNAVKNALSTAINEDSANAYVNGPVLTLPLPDGKSGRFVVAVSNVLPAALKNTYSDIRTFIARGIDDPYAVAKLDYTIFGFHAMIMSPDGWIFIDPVYLGNTADYISYYKRNSVRVDNFVCETGTFNANPTAVPATNYSALRSSGTQLITHRLALACTGEYAAYYGGTKAGAFSGMVTSVNRVDGVYQLEVDIRLTLIPNDTLLVYTNASTDPYTNNSGSTMLSENITNINNVIGLANYDIGHVFSTGGGGVAGLGVVCSSSKARGVTGSSAPIGDNFDIDYVAHEMGHQYGGNHTFNSILGSCNGNRASTAAYEVGSGTTIMAYAGICSTDNTQPHSDPIFHAKSYDEIQTYITTGTGSTCGTITATGNTPPVINAGSNYTIPFNTPFTLTGSATDVDGDALTYLWEEYDLASSGGTISATSTTNPIFRDFIPITSPSRTFPKMSDIVNNVTTFGEVLPAVARSLNFKFTVRDNRPGGGGVTNNNTNVVLTVVNTTNPFRVTVPNTALTWVAGTQQTVTWDVSSTNAGSINCANVRIDLSTDGGFTYPVVVASSVPNNGSAVITVPNNITTTARIRVMAIGNIFFDISNVNFTIVAGSSTLSLITTSALSSTFYCAGSALTVNFVGNGPASASNVYTAQLSDASGSFTAPVAIGTLTSTSSSGSINCTIPSGSAQGTGYFIRVISSSPAVTGSNNGSAFAIYRTVANAGSISGSATVCQLQSAVYTVPVISNATTYTWTLPTGASITSGANTNSITVAFSSTATSGSITVSGSNPCSTGGVSTAFSVTINPVPAAAGAISGPANICQNQSVTFSVGAILNATSYTWTFPSGASIVSGAGSNTITVSFATVGSGTVSVSGTNACSNGTSSSLNIVVNVSPAAPVVSPAGPLTICNAIPVQLSSTVSSGVSYQWQLNGTPISGATNTTYSASVAGSYTVVATQIAAQTVTLTNSTVVSIPDNSCVPATSTIAVSGYSSAISTGLLQVKINITHTYVGDLVIILQAPNGSIVGLSNQTGNAGNSGNNFTNTIFTDAASAVLPTTGAPYTGSYKPVASTFTVCTATTNVTSFGAIGGGSLNPNGNWTLLVFDRAGVDVGTIDNWSLTLPGQNISCSSTSNTVVVNTGVVPNVNALTPSSGQSGTAVIVDGSGFTGATAVTFNGVSASFYVQDDQTIVATAPVGVTSGPVVVTGPCGSGSSATFSVSVQLNLKVFIEGFYRGAGQMTGVIFSSLCDTVQLSLANAVSPYAIVATAKNVLDLNGNTSFDFPTTVSGNSYYLIVSHRNALKVWSSAPVLFNSSVMSYNFTTAANKAFGSNQADLGGGVFGLRSGDVNQDGQINLADFTLMESAARSFNVGYVVNDLTGDNFVESADFSLMENNVSGGYVLQRP